MSLVKQSSVMPTRKMMAVILSGAIIGGVRAALDIVWPDHPLDASFQEFGTAITAVIMVASGYFVKDRKNA